MTKTITAITSKHQAHSKDTTFWEKVATTRWGQYVTDIERELIIRAEKMAGPPGHALEVGCEGGRWSKILADRGWKMTCTDVQSDMLNICRQRVPGATCILVDRATETLPCEAKSISLLLCIEVPPVIQSKWFPAEARRILNQNGILVGTILNRRSWRGVQAVIRGRTDGQFYTHSYAEWRKTLALQSFELIYEQGFCWAPFSRASDSPMVPLFTRAERLLALSRVPMFSPWVAFIARKRTAD